MEDFILIIIASLHRVWGQKKKYGLDISTKFYANGLGLIKKFILIKLENCLYC